jgi:hypothetical protein
MLKTKLLVNFCFILVFAFPQKNVEYLRKQYFSIGNDGKGALKMYQALASSVSNDALIKAYTGAASAAAAGEVSGPYEKLKYFRHGTKLLDEAVLQKPLDAEIRFLRLATQLASPPFLGYNSNVEEDKLLIITTLVSLPAVHPNAYLYSRICTFLIMYGKLTNTNKELVMKQLEKFKPEN